MIFASQRRREAGTDPGELEDSTCDATCEAMSFSGEPVECLFDSVNPLSSAEKSPISSSVCLPSSSFPVRFSSPVDAIHTVCPHRREENHDVFFPSSGRSAIGHASMPRGHCIHITDTQGGKDPSQISPSSTITIECRSFTGLGMKLSMVNSGGESTEPSPSTDHPLSPMVDSSPCSLHQVPSLKSSYVSREATSPVGGSGGCRVVGGEESVPRFDGDSSPMLLTRSASDSDGYATGVRKTVPSQGASCSYAVPQDATYLRPCSHPNAVACSDKFTAELATSHFLPHPGTFRVSTTNGTMYAVEVADRICNMRASDMGESGVGVGSSSFFSDGGDRRGSRGCSVASGTCDFSTPHFRITASAAGAAEGEPIKCVEDKNRQSFIPWILSSFTRTGREHSYKDAWNEGNSEINPIPSIADEDASISYIPQQEPKFATFQASVDAGVQEANPLRELQGDCCGHSGVSLNDRVQQMKRQEPSCFCEQEEQTSLEQAVANLTLAEGTSASKTGSCGSSRDTPRLLSRRSPVEGEVAAAQVVADWVFGSKNENECDSRGSAESEKSEGDTDAAKRQTGDRPFLHRQAGESDEGPDRQTVPVGPPNWWSTLVRSRGFFAFLSDVPSTGGRNGILQEDGSAISPIADTGVAGASKTTPLERTRILQAPPECAQSCQGGHPLQASNSPRGATHHDEEAVIEKDDDCRDKVGDRDLSRMPQWWRAWDTLFRTMPHEQAWSQSTCTNHDNGSKGGDQCVSHASSRGYQGSEEEGSPRSLLETRAECGEPSKTRQLLNRRGCDPFSGCPYEGSDTGKECRAPGYGPRLSMNSTEVISPMPAPPVVAVTSLSPQAAVTTLEDWNSLHAESDDEDDDDEWKFFADEAQMDAVLEAAFASPALTSCFLEFRGSQEGMSTSGSAANGTVDAGGSSKEAGLSRGTVAELRERLRASLKDKSTRARRHFRGLRRAVRARDMQAVRRELADLAEVGGPEVSGIWASVKVGIGVATLASGHVIMGGIMLAMATSAVGSAVLWGRHRDQFRRWMAGEDLDDDDVQGDRETGMQGESEETGLPAEKEGTRDSMPRVQPVEEVGTCSRVKPVTLHQLREGTNPRPSSGDGTMGPFTPSALVVASAETSVRAGSGSDSGSSHVYQGDNADEKASTATTRERNDMRNVHPDKAERETEATGQTVFVGREPGISSRETHDPFPGYRTMEADNGSVSCNDEGRVSSMAEAVETSVLPDCARQ